WALCCSPVGELLPVLVYPRWLYVDLTPSFGRFRVGQAPFHFGLGMVENDGDHPSRFGDYERGAKYERLVVLSGHDRARWRVLVAGDVVYEDERARLVDGDLALRGSLGFAFDNAEKSRIAVLAIVRHQRDAEPDAALSANS